MDDATMEVPVGGPRRATRSAEQRYLGGVCGGLAEHLGIPVMWVRVAFVLATVLSGFGPALYAGLWLTLPLQRGAEDLPPYGLAAASRQGKRPRRLTRGFDDLGPLVALVALAAGGLLLLRRLGWVSDSVLFWPLVLGAVGIALLWRQADEAQRARWAATGRVSTAQAVLGGGGFTAVLRVLVGLGLLVFAPAALVAQSGNLDVLDDMALAAVLGVAGLALIVWPWVHRLTSDLGDERRARIRSQERADVAAHLHDSVLQTLALIQKQAHDSRMVATLARAQERDLRAWLYDDPGRAADSLSAALRAAAADVEDDHGVPVTVVTVGNRPLDIEVEALAMAAREAMVNAARHSGADRVDVFAEARPDGVEVFVRDRGCGFDLEHVPPDRYGVRGSILDRMRRHGGEADVRSVHGEGTEVRLRLGRREEGR